MVVLPPVAQLQSRPFERSDLRLHSSRYFLIWFDHFQRPRASAVSVERGGEEEEETATSVSIMNNPPHSRRRWRKSPIIDSWLLASQAVSVSRVRVVSACQWSDNNWRQHTLETHHQREREWERNSAFLPNSSSSSPPDKIEWIPAAD